MKRDLVEQVVDDITKAIIDAEYQEGEALLRRATWPRA